MNSFTLMNTRIAIEGTRLALSMTILEESFHYEEVRRVFTWLRDLWYLPPVWQKWTPIHAASLSSVKYKKSGLLLKYKGQERTAFAMYSYKWYNAFLNLKSFLQIKFQHLNIGETVFVRWIHCNTLLNMKKKRILYSHLGLQHTSLLLLWQPINTLVYFKLPGSVWNSHGKLWKISIWSTHLEI